MDCSLPGSSVHGISQARILEWVATSFSKFCSVGFCFSSRPYCCSRSFLSWQMSWVLGSTLCWLASHNSGFKCISCFEATLLLTEGSVSVGLFWQRLADLNGLFWGLALLFSDGGSVCCAEGPLPHDLRRFLGRIMAWSTFLFAY